MSKIYFFLVLSLFIGSILLFLNILNRAEPTCERIITIQQEQYSCDSSATQSVGDNPSALEKKVLDLQAVNLHLKQKLQERESKPPTMTEQKISTENTKEKNARGFELVETKTNPSYKIYVHGKDHKDYISEQIRYWGKWSECEGIVDIIHYNKLNPKNTTIVEVGANLGSCTLLMAKHGYRIIAFEPVEFSAKLLKKSLTVNTFDSEVILIEAAASNKKATSKIFSEDQNYGNSFIPAKQDSSHQDVIWSGSNLQEQDIRMVKIDDIVREEVHFMKLDCQGFELYALQGAEQTLRKYMPILYLEFAPFLLRKADVTPVDLLTYLDSLGYTLWRDNQKLQLKKENFNSFAHSFTGQQAQDLVAIKK